MIEQEEIWKVAIEGNGRYMVSNLGRVKSLITNKVMKPYILKIGYPSVNLSFGGKNQKVFYVHRMVAGAFLPAIDGKIYVNHKNGNKQDNNLENLEWCTASENIQHSYDTGIRPVPVRPKHGASPYAKKCVQIFPDGTEKIWDSISEAGDALGCKGNIISACNGKRKHARGCKWRHLNEATK